MDLGLFSIAWTNLYFISFLSVCVEGQFWDKEGTEELGSGGPAGECISCNVGRYQEMAYHWESECKNCSGT